METPADMDTATPAEVAPVLHTSVAGLAQMRYRGTGPKFVRIGGGRKGKVLYRWSDVRAYIEAGTCSRTDDRRAAV